MLNIPFYKPSIGPEEIEEVTETLKSGWLTTGPKAKQFEKEFAAYLQHQHAVAVNSCTAALHLALEAVGLQAGQGVLVPTMTFAATAEVVRYLGGHPLLADCPAEDLNLDVEDAERRIELVLAQGQSVKAIMPVHYGGQVGDVAGVQRLARRYHLKVVEDAAHCCPAFYRLEGSAPVPGQPEAGWQTVGSSADISCYSFYANKTITTGEGGMACTDNVAYADRMRIMSLHGISRDAWKRYAAGGSWAYEILAPGFKYNLTDIAAAIGIQQLRKADELHRLRVQRAALYAQLLGEVEELVLPRQAPNRVHSWHLYVIRLKLERLRLDRAQLITELAQRGIGASVHWMPLHLHPYYRQTYGYSPGDLPCAARLFPQLVSLPIYPELSEGQVAEVCKSLKEILSANLKPAWKASSVLAKPLLPKNDVAPVGQTAV